MEKAVSVGYRSPCWDSCLQVKGLGERQGCCSPEAGGALRFAFPVIVPENVFGMKTRMTEGLKRFFNNSLRAKILFALFFTGVTVAGINSWVVYQTTAAALDQQLAERGKLLASALNHSAMVSKSAVVVQHVVQEVYHDSPELKRIVVATRNPVGIVAASEPVWNGEGLDRLPDPHLRAEILEALKHGKFGHHVEPTGAIVVIAPLEPHISEHMNTGKHAAAGHSLHPETLALVPKPVFTGGASHAGHNHELHKHAMAPPSKPEAEAHNSTYRGIILLEIEPRANDETIFEAVLNPGPLGKELWQLNLTIFAAILSILLMTWWLLNRQVLNPLGAVLDTMRRQHEGDRSARAPDLGGDEIGQVADDFNEMLGALEQSEGRFKDFANTAADWFWETDAELKYTFLSNRYEEATGVPPEQILHRSRYELLEERIGDREKWVEHFDDMQARRPFKSFKYAWVDANGNVTARQMSGKPVLDDNGAFLGYRGSGHNVTESHVLTQELSYQASHDVLTGLENRRVFEQRLQSLLESNQSQDTEHALCYLDLDQFKIINDTCGHVAGDELLRQLGRLLKERVRSKDTVARLGGDEFAVLMENCAIRPAKRVAEFLRKAVEDYRFDWEGKTFRIGVSIGLVVITEASGDITSVLRAVDNACYAAKDEGRNRIHIFCEDDEALARRYGETQWVERINHAMYENRLFLAAQPIVKVRSSHNKGDHFELLLRMQDEDGNTISPSAFLPAAERYGLATKIDCWVITAAFQWLKDEPGILAGLLCCSINLSGQSLGNDEFLKFVIKKFIETGIPPAKICFEVTETAAIAHLSSATRFIKTLRERGCLFSLDDFGSGMSSFAYLKNLPVDFLKIDGMFVKDIVDNPINLAMVRCINDIGHVMGKQTIAEFVENKAILDKLREIGVDYVQGFETGRPQALWEISEQTLRLRPAG